MNEKNYLPTQKARCLIVDRQKLWRTTLSVALEAVWAGISVETTDFHRTLTKTCIGIKPNLVLLDIYPEKEAYSFELASEMRQELDCQIIFMDQQIALSRVERVLRAHIGSYYTRCCSFHALLDGIRMAMNGEHSFCPGLAPHLISSRQGEGLELDVNRDGTDLEILTKREFEVLHHLAEGMNIRECADNLHISRKTVDVHKTRIMSKLEVHSHNALVAVYRNSRLFDRARCS